MSRRRPDSRGLLALLGGAACIGFAPIWVRWSEVGPVATAFYRLLLAVPVMAWWSARERQRGAGVSTRGEPGWAVAAGVCFALDLAAWHGSIRLTTVANATLLANFAPLVVTLGAWWLLGERVTGRFLLGMGVSLVGAWLLTGARFEDGGGRWQGDLLGLTTALFYGGYQLCVARLRRHRGPGRILFWSSLISAPVLGLMAAALGERMVPGTARGWGVVIGLALTAQVLGQGLITYGFAHLPAGYSSLTLLVQPFVAVAAGWILLGEGMTGVQAGGSVILVAGLVLAGTRRTADRVRAEGERPSDGARSARPGIRGSAAVPDGRGDGMR